jgi:Flp pilus assembly CpaF family ATPase
MEEVSFEVRKEEHALRVFQEQLLPLRPFFDDPSVTEIMLNRYDDIWIEREGRVQKVDVAIAPLGIRNAVKAIASANAKDVQPILDCRMPGVRVAAALEPVAIRGATICVRKHTFSARSLSQYVEDQSFAVRPAESMAEDGEEVPEPDLETVRAGGEGLAAFFRSAMARRMNIAVAGATGSGKTTLLNALLAEIPASERVLTVEDTAELKVKTPNHIGFEAAPDRGVTIRSLVKLALRFRPDRIIVGEVRGAEAYDLLDAMNTGHSGGACSFHANSARMALTRLESMVRMNTDAANLPLPSLRQMISDTIRYVVFCSRRGSRRGPEQVLEVLGVDRDGRYETKLIFDARGRYDE